MDNQNENEFYEDKELTCSDCNQPFTFSGGEQRFFAERQFTPPKRCKPCRDQRKARRNGGGGGQDFQSTWTDDPPRPQKRNGRSRRRDRDDR